MNKVPTIGETRQNLAYDVIAPIAVNRGSRQKKINLGLWLATIENARLVCLLGPSRNVGSVGRPVDRAPRVRVREKAEVPSPK